MCHVWIGLTSSKLCVLFLFIDQSEGSVAIATYSCDKRNRPMRRELLGSLDQWEEVRCIWTVKSGLAHIREGNKEGATSRCCWTRKTGLNRPFPLVRIIWQSHKVTLTPRWVRLTTTDASSLAFTWTWVVRRDEAASRLTWATLA